MTSAKKRPRRADISDVTGLRIGLYCRVSKENESDDRAIREKSVDDQEAIGRDWVARNGAQVVDVYRDVDLSGSRFATRERKEFTRLLADIAAGKLDAIWFWEQSRSGRRLDVFAKLGDLSRETGVLWVNKDRVIDPAAYMDMVGPAFMAVVDELASEQTSERVRRGRLSAAMNGRPASLSFGYTRVYDVSTGRSIRDEPDENAKIVREIFDRFLRSESMHVIVRDLATRGIRTRPKKNAPNGNPIGRAAMRRILTNRSYIGQRVHDGEVLEGIDYTFTPPLVDPEVFWAVQAKLADPSRLKWRPAKSELLLSTVLRCGKCGAKMRGRVNRDPRPSHLHRLGLGYYSCNDCSGAAIDAVKIDGFVESIMIKFLSDPEVVECLTSGDDSETAKAARADAEEARVKLQEIYRLAETDPDLDTVLIDARVKFYKARIKAFEDLNSATTLPSVPRDLIGEHAEATWRALPLDIKRQAIRVVAEFSLHPIPPGVWSRAVPTAARVTGRWLLGPQRSEAIRLEDWSDFVYTPKPRPPHVRRTVCVNGHPFTEGNTYITTKGYQQCRTCHAEKQRARHARRLA